MSKERNRDNPLIQFESLVLVAIGGFAGSNLRYFADLIIGGLYSTLIVNVFGSFILGFVLYEMFYSDFLASETRLVVSTGFLSSFTTYSTFALQSIQSPPLWLIFNVVTNYAFGFTAVFLGHILAKYVSNRWS